MRDPATGGFHPSVPLYIKADDAAKEAEQQMYKEVGKALAGMMKKYIDSHPDTMNKGS